MGRVRPLLIRSLIQTGSFEEYPRSIAVPAGFTPVATQAHNYPSPRRAARAFCTIAYRLCAFYDILCVLRVCEICKLLKIRGVGRSEPDQVHQISHLFSTTYRRYFLVYRIIHVSTRLMGHKGQSWMPAICARGIDGRRRHTATQHHPRYSADNLSASRLK